MAKGNLIAVSTAWQELQRQWSQTLLGTGAWFCKVKRSWLVVWGVQTGYLEKLFLLEGSTELERLSKEIVASPSLEVFRLSYTNPHPIYSFGKIVLPVGQWICRGLGSHTPFLCLYKTPLIKHETLRCSQNKILLLSLHSLHIWHHYFQRDDELKSFECVTWWEIPQQHG